LTSDSSRTYFNNKQLSCLREDSKRIHGCAVWCLSSGITNQVEYHIDYAELYRYFISLSTPHSLSSFLLSYETNVIHPPLYAATCQVSSLTNDEMIGGDFYANVRGLEHYKQFGYKGILRSSEEFTADLLTDDWIKIPYRRNRGTLHDGDYPHFSSPIQTITPGKKRVILGLNFFSESVGECCQRAPEHSDAFNRTVKLYQMMSKLGGGGGGQGGKYSSSSIGERSESENESKITPREAEGEVRNASEIKSKQAKKGLTTLTINSLINLITSPPSSRILSERYREEPCDGSHVHPRRQESQRDSNP
jgi:hypothetical protein